MVFEGEKLQEPRRNVILFPMRGERTTKRGGAGTWQ